MIILDTNVFSELFKPRPSRVVAEWVNARTLATLSITAITEAEMLYGLEVMPEGRRRQNLERAIRSILEDAFNGRVLPFDSSAARQYPELAKRMRSRRGPRADFDVQIAAIAKSRRAEVATRNVADFGHLGIPVIDPWRVS